MRRLVILIWLLAQTMASTVSPFKDAFNPEKAIRSVYDEFIIHSTSRLRSMAIRMKIVVPRTASDDDVSPLPVVVFMGGFFMESHRYEWMGDRLVKESGVAWVSTDAMVPIRGWFLMASIGGSVFDIQSPTHGLMSVLKRLRRLNENGPLAGRLDVDKVVLGGHSWGGRVILVSDSRWGGLPSNVIGIFVYAAHAERLYAPGFLPGSMLRLRGSAPILLMAANRDQAMLSRAPSASKTAVEAISRTFTYSVARGRKGYYVEFDGFNHMSTVFPEDRTVRSSKVDGKALYNKTVMMDTIYDIVAPFVREQVFGDPKASEALDQQLFRERKLYIRDAARKG